MDHVFVIMMENHGFNQLLDPSNPNTPDIRRLAQEYGLATDYYGVTHDSMPNYVATLEGNTWNANQDDTEGESPYFNHTNLVDELEQAHVSWKAYIQSLPAPGYIGASNA
jgi:phospholipase C